MASPLLHGGLPNAVVELETISRMVDDDGGERKGNDARPPTLPADVPLLDLAPASPEHGPTQSEDAELSDDSPTWPRPCCGRQGADLWHMMLVSYRLNCFLVAAVLLVILLLTVELMIDARILQFGNSFHTAAVMHWISFLILTIFFVESICRIVVIGLGDYIENKLEVFDGAVIILSFAPMVASTVANGPNSPWDGLSLIVSLRIWRFKQIIDAYVLPIKEENELILQHCERVKQQAEEEVERLSQICQEQAFEIRQLRAHLARQGALVGGDLRDGKSTPTHLADSVTMAPGSDADDEDEDEESLSALRRRSLHKKSTWASPFKGAVDDMNNYVSQYYMLRNNEDGDSAEVRQDTGLPTEATIDIDIHQPKASRGSATASSFVQVDVLQYGFERPEGESVDIGQVPHSLPNQYSATYVVPESISLPQTIPFQITGQIPSRMNDPLMSHMEEQQSQAIVGEGFPDQSAGSAPFHITGQIPNRMADYLGAEQPHGYPIMGQFPTRTPDPVHEQNFGSGLRKSPYQITGQAPTRSTEHLLDTETVHPQYHIMGQIPGRLAAETGVHGSCTGTSTPPPSTQSQAHSTQDKAGRTRHTAGSTGIPQAASIREQENSSNEGSTAAATTTTTTTTTYRETYKVISLEHRNLIFSAEDGQSGAPEGGATRSSASGGSPLQGAEQGFRGTRGGSVYRSDCFGGSGSMLDSASELGSETPSAAVLLSSALEGRPILEQEVCIVKMRTYQAPIGLTGENTGLSLASLYKAMEESGDFSGLNHS
uniref:Ion transport domain-containing protein n=1 Tax=Eptatretus burgeri TaxID=7764 RepID=A0A8C4QFZ9_EPTBU